MRDIEGMQECHVNILMDFKICFGKQKSILSEQNYTLNTLFSPACMLIWYKIVETFLILIKNTTRLRRGGGSGVVKLSGNNLRSVSPRQRKLLFKLTVWKLPISKIWFKLTFFTCYLFWVYSKKTLVFPYNED